MVSLTTWLLCSRGKSKHLLKRGWETPRAGLFEKKNIVPTKIRTPDSPALSVVTLYRLYIITRLQGVNFHKALLIVAQSI